MSRFLQKSVLSFLVTCMTNALTIFGSHSFMTVKNWVRNNLYGSKHVRVRSVWAFCCAMLYLRKSFENRFIIFLYGEKKSYTCNKTGHQQRKHQHLKHPHQQLSGEGEEGHITIRHVVTPQAESQDDAWGEGDRWANTRSDFCKNVSQI